MGESFNTFCQKLSLTTLRQIQAVILPGLIQTGENSTWIWQGVRLLRFFLSIGGARGAFCLAERGGRKRRRCECHAVVVGLGVGCLLLHRSWQRRALFVSFPSSPALPNKTRRARARPRSTRKTQQQQQQQQEQQEQEQKKRTRCFRLRLVAPHFFLKEVVGQTGNACSQPP